MKQWKVINGVLSIAEGADVVVPSADEIFRYFVEGDPSWTDGTRVDEGDAAELSFAKYPLQVKITSSPLDGGLSLGLSGEHRATRVDLPSLENLEAGHTVTGERWFPLEMQSCDEAAAFLRKYDVHLGERISLRVYLALKNAGPDFFADDYQLSAMSFLTKSDEVPKGVNAVLYPYQLDGWRWSRFIISEGLGGILADEMGLGKTLQIISAVADPLKPIESPILVIAPGSLLENWIREFKKFAPQLRTLKHHGYSRSGRPADLRPFDVIVTSYDAVIRDSSMLMMIQWSVIICDEAQYIRNGDSLRARSVKKLPRFSALAVTGTPVENRLTDFWSIADFILPGYLGSQPEFVKLFDENIDGATSLERLASPIMLRRRVADVAQDLPERIDIPQLIELEQSEAETYDRIRNEILAEFGAAATLVALTRLRMYCTHPRLLEKETRNGDPAEFSKYARLTEILEEIFQAGEKAILFTAYTAMTDIIISDIASRFGVFTAHIDGRVPIDDRQPLIDMFSSVSGAALLVLNPRAGGAGLNITAANHVIHYTLEWNPALEDQASARAYRRGQTRPVTVHRLFCAGTVEEVVDGRLSRKRIISEAAVVGVSGASDDYEDIVAALQKSPLGSGSKRQ
jgi:SNF2 family DNA or RNA helicase